MVYSLPFNEYGLASGSEVPLKVNVYKVMKFGDCVLLFYYVPESCPEANYISVFSISLLIDYQYLLVFCSRCFVIRYVAEVTPKQGVSFPFYIVSSSDILTSKR